MPPFGGRNFWQNERSDFITMSLRSVNITTWLILFLLVQPLVTMASAFFESVSHAGE